MKIKSLSSLVLACVILVCGCRDPRQAAPQVAPLPSGLTENEFAKQFAGVYQDKREIGDVRPDGTQDPQDEMQYYIYVPNSDDHGVFYVVKGGQVNYYGTWNIDYFVETPTGSGYYELQLLRNSPARGAWAVVDPASGGQFSNLDNHIQIKVAGKDGFQSSDILSEGYYIARKVGEINDTIVEPLEVKDEWRSSANKEVKIKTYRLREFPDQVVNPSER